MLEPHDNLARNAGVCSSIVAIDLVTDEQSLAALAREWDSLLERSSSNSFFLTHAWITTWWNVFGRNCKLLVLLARDGKELVGVAPLMIAPGRARWNRSIRHLMFLGQHEEVYPEHLDFFVERGREAELSGALADHLLKRHQHEFDVVHFEHVLADAACAPAWSSAFAKAGIDLTLTNRMPCPSIELPSSFEIYMARRHKHFRRQVRYYDRKLTAKTPVRYLIVPKDIGIERGLEEIIRLNRDRWGEEGQSFRTPALIDFHRRVAPILAQKGQVLLMLMAMDDRIVAGRYDFVYSGKVWGYQGGWLREFEHSSLGTVLLARVIQWSIENGLREYDFLGGAARYKDQWSTTKKELADHVGYRPRSLAGQAYAIAMKGKAVLKTRVTPERLCRLKAIAKRLGL
jgi:CelD/BcsL family acetyltransferase involved in cellulose biosynthesis